MKNSAHDYKHLTLKQREIIESSLKDGLKLVQISLIIDKDERTISKEIKRNRTVSEFDRKRSAYNKVLKEIEPCTRINKYPFTCDICKRKFGCLLDHFYYNAKSAQIKYENTLIESRKGVDLTNDEFKTLNELVKNGTDKGQSIYAICEANKAVIHKTPSTIYSYVSKGLLSTTPIDLRRSVKLKPRIKSGKYIKTAKDRAIYINRKIENYYEYIISNPGVMPVQMDTVEGIKNSTKYLLTIHFVVFHFMLVYLINSQTSNEVKRILDDIESKIGLDSFKRLFPLILTDRGKEFMDPDSFETSIDSKTKRTQIFYCDALQSNQKGAAEKNHTIIRYVIPKGSYMDIYNDNQILLLTCHMNSYVRKELGGKTPYDLMIAYFGEDIIKKLFIEKVDPEEVNLTPSLLVK